MYVNNKANDPNMESLMIYIQLLYILHKVNNRRVLLLMILMYFLVKLQPKYQIMKFVTITKN